MVYSTRDLLRELRRRTSVLAPLTPWGEAYYRFWFDTGVLMHRRPQAFDLWTRQKRVRSSESRRMFEIMWKVVIEWAPRWFLVRFDADGVGKDHAWLKFNEGWSSAFEMAGFAVRQRGMDDGPVDIQPYINRFNRLCRAYRDLDHWNTERVRYRKWRR